MRNKQPVLDLVLQKLPVTLQLAAMAIVIALLIGITAGIVSAVNEGHAAGLRGQRVRAVGPVDAELLARHHADPPVLGELGWLPPSGYVPLTEDWRQSLATTIMPAFVLGNAIAAVLMRHTRSAMLQALEQRLRAHRARQGPARALGRSSSTRCAMR